MSYRPIAVLRQTNYVVLSQYQCKKQFNSVLRFSTLRSIARWINGLTDVTCTPVVQRASRLRGVQAGVQGVPLPAVHRVPKPGGSLPHRGGGQS